jgi:magnesium transporter
MENNQEQEQKHILEKEFENGFSENFLKLLDEIPPFEIVEFLKTKSIDIIIEFLNKAKDELSGIIFSGFEKELQINLFKNLDKHRFSKIFSYMYSDVRADFYQELSKEEQIELLPYLEKKIREDVMVLSAYEPDTAGGIMNTDFATVMSHMTAEQALAKIRRDNPSQKMIYYIYIVDENMVLMGMMTLKDLIMSEPKTKISDIHQEFVVFADVNEDRESVAQKIENYDLVALPVVNTLKQLVGIVSHEEAIDVIRAEHAEDMEKFSAIVPTEDEVSYLQTSSFHHFKKRVFWIVALAGIGLISGMIIQLYQDVLEKLMILTLYLPMMTATGGNSGTQSATVVIRALALEEVSFENWFKILFKEAKISFMLSTCVGLLVFMKINFFTTFGNTPHNFDLTVIGILVGISLSIQVITSSIIGGGLPLLVKKFNGDPAVAASPMITTLVDITGLLIYFTVASLALNWLS